MYTVKTTVYANKYIYFDQIIVVHHPITMALSGRVVSHPSGAVAICLCCSHPWARPAPPQH